MESLGIADVTMFVTEHERGYGDYTEERIKRFSIKTVDDIAFVLFCFSLFLLPDNLLHQQHQEILR